MHSLKYLSRGLLFLPEKAPYQHFYRKKQNAPAKNLLVVPDEALGHHFTVIGGDGDKVNAFTDIS